MDNVNNVYQIKMDVKYMIRQLSEDYIPSIKSAISTLEKTLYKAKKRRMEFLASKTTSTISMISGILNPVAGAVVALMTVGTHIVDVISQMKDVKKVETNLSQLYARRERWDVELDNCIKVKEWLQKAKEIHGEEESSVNRGEEDLKTTSKHVDGCKIEDLFFDKEIDANNIRAGNHIFRRMSNTPFGYHHGIALGKDEHGTEKVAEFGKKLKRKKSENSYACQIVDFSTFIGNHEKCYKRHYINYERDLNETLAMAQEICTGTCQWDTYDLYGNNCEHFATYLKLKKTWSGQISESQRIMKTAIEKLPLAGHAAGVISDTAIESVETVPIVYGGQILTRNVVEQCPKGISSCFSGAFGSLLPVINIALLIYEWRKKRPNIEKLETSLKVLQKKLAKGENYLNLLRSLEESISADVGYLGENIKNELERINRAYDLLTSHSL